MFNGALLGLHDIYLFFEEAGASGNKNHQETPEKLFLDLYP
jgi:hypothetical protein